MNVRQLQIVYLLVPTV